MFANAVIFQEPKPKLLSNQYSSQKVCLRQLVKRVTMLQAVRRKGRRLCIGTSGTTMCETTKEWGEMSKLDMHPTVPFDPFNVHCQCRAWIYHQVLRIGDFTPMRPDPIGALLKQPDAFEEQAAKQAIHWDSTDSKKLSSLITHLKEDIFIIFHYQQDLKRVERFSSAENYISMISSFQVSSSTRWPWTICRHINTICIIICNDIIIW